MDDIGGRVPVGNGNIMLDLKSVMLHVEWLAFLGTIKISWQAVFIGLIGTPCDQRRRNALSLTAWIRSKQFQHWKGSAN